MKNSELGEGREGAVAASLVESQGAAETADAVAGQPPDAALNLLAAAVLEMCKVRGWSLHWTHRGAYLHLEASELIEAVRGKRGSVKEEAGDVLLVLMSITEYAGIPFEDVIDQTAKKLEELSVKPHYAGEEWSPKIQDTNSSVADGTA